MKNLLFVLVAMFAMISCGGQQSTPASNVNDSIDSTTVDSIVVVDSLDSISK